MPTTVEWINHYIEGLVETWQLRDIETHTNYHVWLLDLARPYWSNYADLDTFRCKLLRQVFTAKERLVTRIPMTKIEKRLELLEEIYRIEQEIDNV